MRVALYARVSTQAQDLQVQLAALRPHIAQRGCRRRLRTATGMATERPAAEPVDGGPVGTP